MNLTVLIGNIGQHPILRHTTGTGTPVANASLATNRVFKDREGNRQQTTEWHRIVVWGDSALNFAKIVGKGDQVSVQGRLEYRAREVAGQKLSEAVIRVTAWTKLSARKTEAAAEDVEAVEALGEGTEGDGFRGEEESAPEMDLDWGDYGPASAEPASTAEVHSDSTLAGGPAGEAEPVAPRKGRKK